MKMNAEQIPSPVDGIRVGRELSYAVVRFHDALGQRLGLTAMDHKHVDLIDREGPLTAGRLAQLTGLSTGAVTHLVDRLVKAGCVRRIADAADRRRVLIETDPAIAETLGPLLAPFASQANDLLTRFDPQDQLVIADYLQRMTSLLETAAAELMLDRAVTSRTND